MNVELTSSLQFKIFEQMRETYPNEGGGFLLGLFNGDTITIKEITQVKNTFELAEQYHRYAMTPQDWMRLEDQADELGLSLVGYYHSHPDSAAIPSEYDRIHALPNFVYIITSVVNGKAVDMRVWQLAEDRSRFWQEALTVI